MLNMSIKSISVFFILLVSSVSLWADDDIIAKVNDSVISTETLAVYGEKRIGVRPGKGFPEEKKQELIAELINRELIYQDAVKLGLDKDELVLMQIHA